MSGLDILIAQARGSAPEAHGAIDAVAARRRTLARAILSRGGEEYVLREQLAEVEPLARSYLPRGETSDDDALIAEISMSLAATDFEVQGLMAAMALAPAHHFTIVPSLTSVPDWLRLAYASYLLCPPIIFLQTGEADRLARHLTEAIEKIHTAIFLEKCAGAKDLAIVVAKGVNTMAYFNEQNLRPCFRRRAEIIEWLLAELGLPTEGLSSLVCHDRPRVGILHRSIVPGTESYYLLAHLEGRPKDAAEVILYVLAETAGPLVATFDQWVDKRVKLPNSTVDAVARIREDDLDLLLVASNITAEISPALEIAAHRLAKVQVVGGASPVSPAFTSFDLFLSGEENDPSPAAQSHYEERLARLPPSVSYYAFAHDTDPQTISCSRADLGLAEDQIVFFSAANYFKITPELVETWCSILSKIRNSCLVLMPFNPNWGSAYPGALFKRRLDRDLHRFGISPERVKFVDQVPTRADVHALMALADIYLDSFPFSGACSLLDPMQVGLPIVARAGTTFRSAVAGSLLRPAGLGDMLCPDSESYVARAVRLAEDVTFRREERARVVAASKPIAPAMRTLPYAAAFTGFCVDAVSHRRRYVDGLKQTSPANLCEAVTTAAAALSAAGNHAFRRLTDLRIVTQLLVPYAKSRAGEGRAIGRIVDVGACVGEASLPFLNAGFTVEMFEPDPECGQRLTALCARFPGRARHHAKAVTGDNVASVTFNKRALGLSGLGKSPFASDGSKLSIPATTLRKFLGRDESPVDVIKIDAEGHDLEILKGIDFEGNAPALVMVEFGTQFQRQTADRISLTLRRMDQVGYRAAIFTNRMLDGFGKTGWACELADLTVGQVDRRETGDGFGNIVFFRKDDTTFLTCLLLLLESFAPAQTRMLSPLAASPATGWGRTHEAGEYAALDAVGGPA